MPLSPLQTTLLRLLSGLRSPESSVAGATPLSRTGPRTSDDIDIFHDRGEAVASAAEADAQAIKQAGYKLRWLRQDAGLWSALVGNEAEETKLEWVHDSNYRFFPVLPDSDFGYVLHPADVATNKALAAAGRREPRDVIDLLQIHEEILPLGAVLWAAVAKDPGWSPEALLSQIARNGRYRDDDLAALELQTPVSAASVSRNLRAALGAAEEFILQMPSEKAGLLFFDGDRLVQPDPTRLERYLTHEGSRGGHWPSSAQIASAMLSAWSPKR